MISTRFALPVAAALAVALIPTVIHSYWGATLDDGLRTANIPAAIDAWESTPTARRASWVEKNFATTDFIERTYRAGGAEATLFVVRSFDAKRLYHHPELAILRGLQTTPRGIASAAARPEVPLHVLDTKRGDTKGVAVFAMLYDGSFVGNPLLFQLEASAELLVSGRRPFTLFLSSDLAGSRTALDDAPATRLLLAAIESFERQRGASHAR